MRQITFKQFSDLNDKEEKGRKIRSTIFDEYVGEEVSVTGTIDNPRIVDDVLYVYLVNDLGCIRVCVPPAIEEKLTSLANTEVTIVGKFIKRIQKKDLIEQDVELHALDIL